MMPDLMRWPVRLGRAVLLLLLLILLAEPGAARAGDGAGEEIPEGWRFMPRLGASIEYGGFIAQQADYASLLRRRLEIDLVQYRRNIFYLNFDEKTYFGTPFDKWDFNLMKYDVAIAGYRYDFGNFYLGIFMHHQCNNPIHLNNYDILSDRERANIYDAGLEFLTKNMRLGMKDRGINFDSPDDFEFLGRFAGEFSASRVVVRENIKLNWLAKGQLRYDILRYYCLIPYVEVSGDVVVGPLATKLAPAVEAGARYHLRNMDFTPFLKWGRDQESLAVSGANKNFSYISKNYLYAGGRVEVLLDRDSFPGAPTSGQLQWFPETHGVADYGLYLQKRYFNAHGNNELDFEALRWDPWTIFIYTNMNFDSRKQDFKPDKVNYWLQYGLTYAWHDYFIEGFVKDQQRLDAVTYRGTQERSNLAGLRAGTKGMKPGHYNDGISFSGPQTFQWLNLWNGQGAVGHFFNNRDWQYLWDASLQVRWDPLRWHIMVPYIQGEVNWMSGGGQTPNALEYALEPGARFHGVLDLAVYVRFQHRKNVLFFQGPSENETLFGFKVLF